MVMAFIEYWHEIDTQMLALYAIDTMDAGTPASMIAEAQDDGWTPKEFVLWFGEKYGLKKLPGAA
jgi:hypothetical protein